MLMYAILDLLSLGEFARTRSSIGRPLCGFVKFRSLLRQHLAVLCT